MDENDFRPTKAYENDSFLSHPDGRPIRLLSEYLEPKERFENFQIEDTILFFGSARLISRESAEAEVAAAKNGDGDLERAEMQLKMSHYYEATRELAHKFTEWSKGLKGKSRRFVVCSGGGPGIMEAANRGASEAKGENVGLCISLPFEASCNPYITRKLAFEFHYFFMRKFWFLYLAKAMVLMPGGFGTLDELMEGLTLIQTGKMKKKMPIVLYGKEFWEEVVNFEALVKFGTISREDLELFHVTDSIDDAFDYVTEELGKYALDHPGIEL